MNFGSPKPCRSLTAECSLPPFLSWSEDILLDPKILIVDGTTEFHFQSLRSITEKKRGTHGNAFLFVIHFYCISLVLQGMSLRLTFGIVSHNPETLTWPEWEMSPILLPWKEHPWWRSVVRLSFSPVDSGRKHLSPLSSAQIRCLYLFRVEEINPERSTVGQGARKRERRRKRGERQWSSLVFNCLCVSMWHLLESNLCSVGRLEHWPPALTPFQLPFLPPCAPPPLII